MDSTEHYGCFGKGSNPLETTKIKVMKYIFRGVVVFEYDPNAEYDKVKQGKHLDVIPAFNHCRMIDEDYKLLGEFFNKVYRHTQGENVVLEDIVVG